MPYPECVDCVATKFCKIYSGEVDTPERHWCNARWRLDKALELSLIPPEYVNANIYNYKRDKHNDAIYRKVLPYIENICEAVDGGLNMFFYANSFGTGKTFHAAMFLNHYIYKTCTTERFDFETPLALFVVYAELMDMLRYSRSDEQVGRFVEVVNTVPLLLLDDVGSGTMSDYVREQTYMILNHRFNHRLSTIITTNYGLRELASENLLGARNVSRITARCDGAEVGGPDRRRAR